MKYIKEKDFSYALDKSQIQRSEDCSLEAALKKNSPLLAYKREEDGSIAIDPLTKKRIPLTTIQPMYESTSEMIAALLANNAIIVGDNNLQDSEFDYEDDGSDPECQVPINERDGFTMDDVEPYLKQYKSAEKTYKDALAAYEAGLKANKDKADKEASAPTPEPKA